MKYYDSKKKLIEIEKEIGKGGEGVVFLLKNGDILKIYNKSSLSVQKEKKIKALISKKMKFEGICFPKDIIFNGQKQFAGYTMLKAEGYEMQKTLFQPKLLKERFPNWTREDLCIIGLNILNKIKYLHLNNVIVGDINPNNILLTEEKDVYFVDTDSYQIDNYPCPVGTTHFTAPELQGINFETSLRTISHENFAISTLLFMIFLPGKSPYSFQGGGSIKENILTKNFSYPLGDDDNLSAPKGMWEFIWYELSFDLRSSFYNTFKKGARFNVDYWINTLSDYQTELLNSLYQKEIIPSDTSKILKGRTLNMNRRDITVKDNELRIIKTELITNPNEQNYAVIELSTKAVKLLFSKNNKQLLNDGFSFDFFYREGRKTETGKGLNDKNIMDMVFFNNRVIPEIQQMIRKAEQNDIEIIYSVATAAYRTALNRNEIIETIKSQCGLNVKILSKEEESIATITAFLFSKPKHLNEQFSSANNILMIDQGGGSTEITLYDINANLKGNFSLNLGTTVMKTILFREATQHTTLDSSLKNATKLIKDRLKTFKNSKNSEFLKNNTIDLTLSVGTAITNATDKKGNRNQHGTILTLERIKNVISRIDENLKLKYYYISDLLNDLEEYEREGNKNKDRLDNLIVMRVGLVMFVEIMENLNIKELIVSGTGLWYGIYFQQLYNLN